MFGDYRYFDKIKDIKPVIKLRWVVLILLIVIFIMYNYTGSLVRNLAPDPAANLSREGVSGNVNIVVKLLESRNYLGDNQSPTAKAQGVYKIITIELTNNQKDAITIDSNNFKLIDDHNREFSISPEAQSALLSPIFQKPLDPGMSIQGKIIFDVSPDAQRFVLKASGGMPGTEIMLKVENRVFFRGVYLP